MQENTHTQTVNLVPSVNGREKRTDQQKKAPMVL